MPESMIYAVGDVFVDRDNPASAFPDGNIRPGDGMLFGNCEGVFSDSWERAPSCGSPVVAAADRADRLATAGFSVVSLANNHSVDGGYAALLNCQQTLRDLGIATAGAGADIRAAREPAVLDLEGSRIATLAYSAVFPHGYEARAGYPGLAPVRAHTVYTPWETNEWNPGLAPKVSTQPFAEDLAALRADVTEAARQYDVVVVSVHWGDFTRPFVLTDHERRVAHAAIDAGADLVLGHHHHMLRGVEFYRGKPIFYGLGHYLFDLPNLPARIARDGYLGSGDPADQRALARRFGEYRLGPREGYPLLPFHEDSRMTGMAVVTLRQGTIDKVGFRPALIDPENNPQHAQPESPEGQRVLAYLQRCCDEEGLPTQVIEDFDPDLPKDCARLVDRTETA
jgi:poly-gamma-glutamate synthesis protein (capsule biosynthesis protein)